MSDEPRVLKVIRKFNNFLELESVVGGTNILINLDNVLSIVPSDRGSCTVILNGWDLKVNDSYDTIVQCMGPATEIQITEDS